MRLRQWLTGEWCLSVSRPCLLSSVKCSRWSKLPLWFWFNALTVNVIGYVLASTCWALSLSWSKWNWFWADWRLWSQRGFRSMRSLQRIFSLLWTKRVYVTDQTLLLQIVCYSALIFISIKFLFISVYFRDLKILNIIMLWVVLLRLIY